MNTIHKLHNILENNRFFVFDMYFNECIGRYDSITFKRHYKDECGDHYEEISALIDKNDDIWSLTFDPGRHTDDKVCLLNKEENYSNRNFQNRIMKVVRYYINNNTLVLKDWDNFPNMVR